MKRLKSLAAELDVSVQNLITDLKTHQNLDCSANSKVNDEVSSYLYSKFQLYKGRKQKIDEKRKVYYFDVNLDFRFEKGEVNQNKKLYNEHIKLFSEIDKLNNKVDRYFGLEHEEIEALLKLKYYRIENIQKEIKKLRQNHFIDKRSNDNDPHEDFRWGGLSGEEALDGYWNTD